MCQYINTHWNNRTLSLNYIQIWNMCIMIYDYWVCDKNIKNTCNPKHQLSTKTMKKKLWVKKVN